MGKNTKIEWAHHTWNLVWGCTKVSEACQNCYAEAFARRVGLQVWGPQAPRRVMSDHYWREPLAWNREAARLRQRMRVFCSSMADVFEDHPTVNEQRGRLWPLIRETQWLDWLLLTKRPENFSRFLPWYEGGECPGNVWLGVTAETQRWADVRIPLLLNAPAQVRFISAEPLLGSLNIRYYLRCPECKGQMFTGRDELCRACYAMDRVDWVIAGGESGHRARPIHPAWVRDLRDQCVEAGVAFHFKQWGEWAPYEIEPKEEVGQVSVSTQFKVPDGKDVFFISQNRHAWDTRTVSIRVGKAAAGRELDGRTWDEVPERRAV